jgi:hypothetical protein
VDRFCCPKCAIRQLLTPAAIETSIATTPLTRGPCFFFEHRNLLETAFSADTSNVVVIKDMFHPNSRLLLTLSIFAVAAAYAVAAEQPPVPQDSKSAAPAETAGKPAAADPTGGKTAGTPAPAGGVVVFIDPATGKIRQPDASEIGALVTPAGSVAPKAPEPVQILGPGGAVGAKLGADSLTYMVVTTTPEGKLAMDCVTGEKTATAQVTGATAPKAKEASASSAHPQDTQRPQDTQNVKIPR